MAEIQSLNNSATARTRNTDNRVSASEQERRQNASAAAVQLASEIASEGQTEILARAALPITVCHARFQEGSAR
jgi:hypothetical protein